MKKKLFAILIFAVLICLIAVCLTACNGNSYKVKLYSDGELVMQTSVEKGRQLYFSGSWYTAPVKEGYTLVGWENESNGFILELNQGYVITGNVKLNAVWEIKDYTCTAVKNINGAGEISIYKSDDPTQEIKTCHWKDEITANVDSVNLGYDFLGWYNANDELLCAGKTYVFDMPSKKVELTAKFSVQDAFADFKFDSTPSELTITGYNGSDTVVNIPVGTTAIGNSAFDRCIRITDIVIPEGVTSIGQSAFANCSNLVRVDIPSTVRSIGSTAFYICKSLERVEIPEGVTTIEKYTFTTCSSLTTVVIPRSVTSIGAKAFESCFKLDIYIPSSVQTVASSAFYLCSNAIIKCETPQLPSGWASDWYKMSTNVTVEWGVLS